MSEDPKITQRTFTETDCLQSLTRFLRIRRKFCDELNESGFYLLDFLITQAVVDCNRVGLQTQAREVLEKAQFENAQLPKLRSVKQGSFEKTLLSRMERILKLQEDGRRFINAQKRHSILERALRSTYADLKDLGFEQEADQILSNFGRESLNTTGIQTPTTN